MMNGPTGENEETDNPDLAWCYDDDLRRRRTAAQVKIVLSSLKGSAVHPEDPGAMLYMYRRGRILVRDADLPRVHELLRGKVGRSLINGVTSYIVDDTQVALARIDRAHGVGVATPDHVVHIAPASACPATEIMPVDQENPDPDVRQDPECDGTGTLVKIVDTGFIPSLVDQQHFWLGGVSGDVERYKPRKIRPYVGHGTFIAGIVKCIAPQAEVGVEGFLTRGGAIFESNIIEQLSEALDDMPDVISLSAGCTTRHNIPSLGFEVLWEQRLRHYKGTVLVAAAGNDGSRDYPLWPAAFPWAVSVGALDREGRRAPYSNFGSWVDLYALGSDMRNAFPNGTYRYREPPRSDRRESATIINGMGKWSGTSFSTPVVAGMIAARVSRTGQSGRQAANSILRIARVNARRGIGAIAHPDMACEEDPGGAWRD
jgi:hypothetical protein